MSERTVTFFECDHMRAVVHLEDGWHHISPTGNVGSPCGANFAYRQEAVSTDHHYLMKRVRDEG